MSLKSLPEYTPYYTLQPIYELGKCTPITYHSFCGVDAKFSVVLHDDTTVPILSAQAFSYGKRKGRPAGMSFTGIFVGKEEAPFIEQILERGKALKLRFANEYGMVSDHEFPFNDGQFTWGVSIDDLIVEWTLTLWSTGFDPRSILKLQRGEFVPNLQLLSTSPAPWPKE